MGFLNKFLSSNTSEASDKLPGKLVQFLNTVDTLYMEAYTLKSAKDISKYLSRGCAQKLQSAVCSINARYFGDEKFRHTTWSKEREEVDRTIILKTVVFDKVKIAGKLSINIATDYEERWYILTDNSKYVVDRIEGVVK